MKLRILALALLLGGFATAQNPYIAIEGAFDTGNGVVVSTPRTFVAVDITVERDVTVSGPYARYAQKFLGVGASLADKKVWSIKSAELGVAGDMSHLTPAAPAADESQTVHYATSEDNFARVQPDKVDITTASLEESARQAAATIFSLRRHRMELITGEAGENVFGEGLGDALAEIARLEQSYLELFFGKRVVTTQTRRYVVSLDKSERNYMVCRFSAAEGLLPSSDLSGDVVMLQIEPSDSEVDEAVVAGVKETGYVTCRVADESLCTLICGRERLTQRVLPVMEFGKSANIKLQRRR